MVSFISANMLTFESSDTFCNPRQSGEDSSDVDTSQCLDGRGKPGHLGNRFKFKTGDYFATTKSEIQLLKFVILDYFATTPTSLLHWPVAIILTNSQHPQE